ncbi:hypothetical protein ACFLQS_04530 [Actinomycetota bacterium]
MGEKIRTAIEIAMEKAEKLTALSKKEKEQISINKKIEPILARFFKGDLDPESLWKELREEKKLVLVQFQIKLVETITISLPQEELKRRKSAVLALEHLKKNPSTVNVEDLLNSLEDMSLRYLKEKEDFYSQLKSHIENNPKLLLRQIDSGGKKMAVRLSVEEAINQSQDWNDFVSEHEKRYISDFSSCLYEIKKELGLPKTE